MKRRLKVMPLVLMLVLMVGCATLQESWDKATPTEKAQFTIGKYQKAMITALEGGNAFVTQNPKYKEDYQKKVIPAVKIVQGILDGFIAKGASGEPFTFNDVDAALSAKTKEIIDILLSWGMKPK